MPQDERARVAAAEKEIDAHFESRFPLKGVWKPAAIEALLAAAQLLVTGHRTGQRQHMAAVRTLYVNVIGALDTSLRMVDRLGSAQGRAPPRDIMSKAVDCISLAMVYMLPEHAFFSYWKGYARVSFPSKSEIEFVPTGGELDARLHSHRTDDGLVLPRRAFKNPIANPRSTLTKKFVKSLIANSRVQRIGGFSYFIDDRVVQDAANAHYRWLAPSISKIPPIDLGGFFFTDVLRALSLLWMHAYIHWLVSVMLAADPTDLSTSPVWEAPYRRRTDWLNSFASLPEPERIMDAVTLDFADKGGDVAVTPMVAIDSQHLGIVPSVVLDANQPRNALALVAKRFSVAYSTYSASNENRLLDEFQAQCGRLMLGRKIGLPTHKGKQLPDIDLLVGETTGTEVVVGEVKWQLSASDVRDVIARNDYLKKGTAQLAAIRAFLGEVPDFFKERRLVEQTPQKIHYVLLCKGHMASEEVLRPGIIAGDYDVFCKYLERASVSKTIERLNRYDYLPVPGRDFRLHTARIQFGKWTIGWKQFEALHLPPDTETDILEELYTRYVEFMPPERR